MKSHNIPPERVAELEARAKSEAHRPPTDAEVLAKAQAAVAKAVGRKKGQSALQRTGGVTSWQAGFDDAIATLEAMRDEQRKLRADLGIVTEEPEDLDVWPERANEDHFTLGVLKIHTPWMKEAEAIATAHLALPCARCDSDGYAYTASDNPYERGAARCRCYGWKRNAKLFGEARLPAASLKHGLNQLNWDLIEGARLVPTAYGDDYFQPISLQSEARRIIRHTSHEDSGRFGLLLYGDTGTAKSHLIQGIARRATLAYGARSRWVNWPSLLERLKSSFNDTGETVSSIVGWLTSTDILVLDEIGGENVSGWAQARLEEVLTRCENSGITVLASTNYGKARLIKEIGEPSVSRLLGLCEIVEMRGRDYRAMSVKERGQ